MKTNQINDIHLDEGKERYSGLVVWEEEAYTLMKVLQVCHQYNRSGNFHNRPWKHYSIQQQGRNLVNWKTLSIQQNNTRFLFYYQKTIRKMYYGKIFKTSTW